jgi:heme-degrading monooxygenase HmoA
MIPGGLDDAFVVTSRIRVPVGGESQLESAFRRRLGAVDSWPGFLGLQVWRDTKVAGDYMLVLWWTTPELYRDYMHSRDHKTSHARVPKGALAPVAVAVNRFELVAL